MPISTRRPASARSAAVHALGAFLFELQLRMRVHTMAEVDQPVLVLINGGTSSGLGIHHG